MIGWLSGEVMARDPARGLAVIAAGGVGYEVRVSVQTLAVVGEPGGQATLWIHTHAREDALWLYGFQSHAEKELFLLLVAVPKVGPQSAMAVLGGFPLVELIDTIAQGDVKALQKIPGIGKKTAEQIVLSLSEKAAALRGRAGPAPATPAAAAAGDDGVVEEARAVLVNLGWRVKQVDVALEKVLGGDAPETLDDLVRRTLAGLMER